MKTYKDGILEGIRKYAYWKDSKQYVGTTGKTLEQAIKEIEEEYAETKIVFCPWCGKRLKKKVKTIHYRKNEDGVPPCMRDNVTKCGLHVGTFEDFLYSSSVDSFIEPEYATSDWDKVTCKKCLRILKESYKRKE